MVSFSSRQLFMLNLPAVVVLLGYLWYKRKRIGTPSDPGDKKRADKTNTIIETNNSSSIHLDTEPKSSQKSPISQSVEESPVENTSEKRRTVENTPDKSFSRSFSAPIPIILPKELRYSKTLNISDQELDQQIEKLKSLKRTDPFSLISQGRSTNCLSSSQKLNGYSLSPPNLHISSEKDKTVENNNHQILETTSLEQTANEVIEEIASIDNQLIVPSLDLTQQEIFLSNNEEVIEEIVPVDKKEIVADLDLPCASKNFETASICEIGELIGSVDNRETEQDLIALPEEIFSTCNEEVIHEIASVNNEKIVPDLDIPCPSINLELTEQTASHFAVEEITSVDNQHILPDKVLTQQEIFVRKIFPSNNQAVIEEIASVDNKEIVTDLDLPCPSKNLELIEQTASSCEIGELIDSVDNRETKQELIALSEEIFLGRKQEVVQEIASVNKEKTVPHLDLTKQEIFPSNYQEVIEEIAPVDNKEIVAELDLPCHSKNLELTEQTASFSEIAIDLVDNGEIEKDLIGPSEEIFFTNKEEAVEEITSVDKRYIVPVLVSSFSQEYTEQTANPCVEEIASIDNQDIVHNLIVPSEENCPNDKEVAEKISHKEVVPEIISVKYQEVVQDSIFPPKEVFSANDQEVTERAASPCKEVLQKIASEDHQKLVQKLAVHCEDFISLGEQEVVQFIEETVNPLEEVLQGDKPCEEEFPQTNTVVVEEADSSSDCDILPSVDLYCNKMTSTNHKDIVQESDNSCVNKMDKILSTDNNDIEKSNTWLVETAVTASKCVQEGTKPIVQPTNEDVASSAENSISTDDLNATLVPSEEPSSSAGTGAVPKKKKKKFRKIECELKDLASQLNQTRLQSTSKAPAKRRSNQKSRCDSGCEREEMQGQSSGRESAIVSPSDTMMAVSGSLNSLNSSEGSHDSGKGCSDTNTPPPQPMTFYEFLVPLEKVGKLIGKGGSFVTWVYTKTNAHMVVRNHPSDKQKKICIVEGTEQAIQKAMAMVKQKFPRDKFKPYLPPKNQMDSASSYIQVQLPAAVNAETHISCIVSPMHIFVQLPFNPSYPVFVQLHEEIQKAYVSDDIPLVPKPVGENAICVGFMFGGWNRVVILSADQETEKAYVKCLDYGGFAYVPFGNLKQMRRDLMYVPFQAIECVLANIEPVHDEWPKEAYDLVTRITKRGQCIYTHIVDFTPENIPLINIQAVDGQEVIWVNEQLVAHGFAVWKIEQDSVKEGEAVGNC